MAGFNIKLGDYTINKKEKSFNVTFQSANDENSEQQNETYTSQIRDYDMQGPNNNFISSIAVLSLLIVFFICIISSHKIYNLKTCYFATFIKNRFAFIKNKFVLKKERQNMFSKKVLALAIYVILIMFQLIFFVPYEQIHIFRSKQNVPHTEVIGNGYASITEISKDVAIMESDKSNAIGKRIDTPQLAINITITTIVAVVIYFLFIHKEKKSADVAKTEVVEFPYIDFDELAFADPETKAKAQKEYAEAMYRYIKSKL